MKANKIRNIYIHYNSEKDFYIYRVTFCTYQKLQYRKGTLPSWRILRITLFESTPETRTKVIYKNVSQSCHKIRKYKSVQQNFYQNGLINECAIKNLAKRALCDLS